MTSSEKNSTTVDSEQIANSEMHNQAPPPSDEQISSLEPPKRKRGRPRKVRTPEEIAEEEAKPKRKRGRPPKTNKTPKLLNSVPTPALFKKKKVNTKPLDDSLPGTGLADWFISTKNTQSINEESQDGNTQNHTAASLNKPTIISNDSQASKDPAPSWELRDWVTNPGERLIIQSNQVKRERQQFEEGETLDIKESITNPDNVSKVIQKIKMTYGKKKTDKKKGDIEENNT